MAADGTPATGAPWSLPAAPAGPRSASRGRSVGRPRPEPTPRSEPAPRPVSRPVSRDAASAARARIDPLDVPPVLAPTAGLVLGRASAALLLPAADACHRVARLLARR